MDNKIILQQFEEIEEKIEKLIEACKSYKEINVELRSTIEKLEGELQGKVEAEKSYAAERNSEVIKLCAKVEEEMVDFDEDEKQEMLNDLGVAESGLDQIIHKGFDKLGLMSYFTAGVKEVRAWTIRKNTTAPKAAAVIHNDFEKGFIRAEVISYEDYIACGSENAAKEAGKNRLEGKEYIVQDGDIMHFRFNV